jgi:hypothetical protein
MAKPKKQSAKARASNVSNLRALVHELTSNIFAARLLLDAARGTGDSNDAYLIKQLSAIFDAQADLAARMGVMAEVNPHAGLRQGREP